MANSRLSGNYYEYAIVDEEPGGDGYFTNPVPDSVEYYMEDVDPHLRSPKRLFFSVRQTGDSAEFDITITLQFRCRGDDDWTDYDTFTTVDRVFIEGGGSGVQWRAGVKEDTSSGDTTNYNYGEVTFGFDW